MFLLYILYEYICIHNTIISMWGGIGKRGMCKELQVRAQGREMPSSRSLFVVFFSLSFELMPSSNLFYCFPFLSLRLFFLNSSSHGRIALGQSLSSC